MLGMCLSVIWSAEWHGPMSTVQCSSRGARTAMNCYPGRFGVSLCGQVIPWHYKIWAVHCPQVLALNYCRGYLEIASKKHRTPDHCLGAHPSNDSLYSCQFLIGGIIKSMIIGSKKIKRRNGAAWLPAHKNSEIQLDAFF